MPIYEGDILSSDPVINPVFVTVEVGDVPGGNYFQVEPDGTWSNLGESTTWDELSKDFVGRNLYLVAGRIDYNFVELTLDFSTTARYPNEPIGMVTQAMHSRKADSDVKPHIHWIQNSDNNPNILVEYRLYNNGEVPPAWTLMALSSSNNAFPFTAVGQQQITNIPLPAGHGVGKGLSFTIDMKIYRDSQNTSLLFSGADSYSGEWSAKYYDVHFEKDMNGSREEYVK